MDEYLAQLEQQALNITPERTPEAVLQILNDITYHLSQLKRIKELAEAAVLEHVKIHGPLMTSPTEGYYATTPKTVRCTNVRGLVDKLLEVGGGDCSDSSPLAQCLSSSAFKHGACSKFLDETTFDQFFETTYPDKLEDGNIPKKLVRLDKRFAK